MVVCCVLVRICWLVPCVGTALRVDAVLMAGAGARLHPAGTAPPRTATNLQSQWMSEVGILPGNIPFECNR
jgi:hypothetical protein